MAVVAVVAVVPVMAEVAVVTLEVRFVWVACVA